MIRPLGGLRLTILALATVLTLLGSSALWAGPPPGAPTADDPAAWEGLSDEQIELVKNDEVVILKKPEDVEGRKMITAAMIMNQPIDKAWELMTSGWRQEEYLPSLTSSELVEKWDGGDKLKMRVDIINVRINYRIVGVRDKKNYHSQWELDPDFKNDMREVSGFWRFYYLDDNRTLARYGTWVEVGFWIPGVIQEYMTRQNLPDALEAQKKWVDSGGTYRKKGYKPDE